MLYQWTVACHTVHVYIITAILQFILVWDTSLKNTHIALPKLNTMCWLSCNTFALCLHNEIFRVGSYQDTSLPCDESHWYTFLVFQ